ncbi:MAG TPA: glycosyltransferase family 4 protein, partial [Candidatus Krumholzibacterium sp.]|nr:glycosyltransferase family 4 protein [Candidatus Krumholzibacterium sp.]
FGVMYLNHGHLPAHRYWWYNHEQIAALRYHLDHYIVLNDGTQGRDALIKRGIPPEKITWLPNGMDKSWADLEVDPSISRREFGLPEDKTLLVTYSRLVRSKRVELFLEAAAGIRPALRERIALVIGGDGPDREALERRAADLGLSGCTFFTGAIRYDRIPVLLKSCDIFVGTNELTNMSMPPCESLLCGVPVVAFDVAGTSEAVIDGRTGLLCPDNDIEALTASIERLLEDPALRERLGRQAMEFARSEFMSWEDRTSSEVEVLRSLIAR